MGIDASRDQRVVAVLVAWNRRDLLAQGLAGLAAQTRRPDAVMVIDNASTDDSAEVARRHEVVTEVVTLPENVGGAGGFAAGIARAVHHHGAELVWLMDDDTVPTPDALDRLLDARVRYPGRVTVAASRVDWSDGRIHPMNTPRVRPGASSFETGRAGIVDGYPIRSASFVSVLIDAEAVRIHGLPEADYFLWNDDFEYTGRLLRDAHGVFVPASRVYHLTRTYGDSEADPGARFAHEVRNKVWAFTRSGAFGPADTVRYGGSSALRWARTVARSHDRAQLLDAARRGLAEARTAPRSTVEVLAGTPVSDDVFAIEHGAGRA